MADPAGFVPDPPGFVADNPAELPKMYPAHYKESLPILFAPEKPVEPNPLNNPIEALLTGIMTTGPALKLAEGLVPKVLPMGLRMPWLPQAVARGVTTGAAFGAVDPAASGQNPIPGAATGALAGGILGPAAEAAVGGAVKLLRGKPPTVPGKAPISPVEPVETMPVAKVPLEAPAAPVAKGVPVEAPAPSATVAAEPGPLKPTNAQQFPLTEDIRASLKNDPDFQRRVAELGGGRVQTNEATLKAAVDAGPLSVDEIANWKAETPLNAVEQTRGLLTYDHFQQQRLKGVLSGDLKAAADANAQLVRMQPGIENIRATGGRMTQAQGMFVQDEMSKMLNELADMQEKGVPFEQVTKIANQQLKQLRNMAKRQKASKDLLDALDVLQTAATFAKLTSPVTHAVNTVSNAATFATVQPLQSTGTALAYLAQGEGNSARAQMSAMFGTTMGFRSGIQRYLTTLMDEIAEGKAAESLGHRGNIPLPKALRPFDVFRQLSAADAFWKGVLEDQYLHRQAMKLVLDEGVPAAQRAARIKALVENPPEAWKKEALTYGKEFTFQTDPDNVLAQFNKLQRIPGVRLFIPFMQTPYNIAKFQFERSPAGILSRRNLLGLSAGGRDQAEAFGRLSAGVALSAGTLALVNSTEATGDYPTDPHERARWQAENIQPYSIKLPNGQWLAYNRFAPVGQYIGQAVALRDAIRINDEKGMQDAASYLMLQGVKQINDMPFLSGLSDALKALQDPERSAGKFFQGVATGFVPNILRDVRNQTDPTMRQARGALPAMQNMVPGLSQKLPPQVDVLGEERTYEPDRLARASKVLTTRRTSPERSLLDQVGWSPSMPEPTLTKKGFESVTLTGDDLARYQKEIGAATKQALTRFVGNKRFVKLDKEDQVDALNRAVNDARKRIRTRWVMEKVTTRKKAAA